LYSITKNELNVVWFEVFDRTFIPMANQKLCACSRPPSYCYHCICIWPLLPMPMHLHLAKSKDVQVQQLPKCRSCYSYLQLWLLKHQ
jgi:hypothetical protein